MAYKVITTYVRPNTGVDFPKMSDHNSDHYDWVRQYFSDNAISVSFELSEDELTLIGTTECANRSIWEGYRTATEATGNRRAAQLQGTRRPRRIPRERIRISPGGGAGGCTFIKVKIQQMN